MSESLGPSLGPGSTFAGCQIEAVGGRGGMGVVFRATQLALGRLVALKAIAPELAADPDFRERFQRESHLAASIDHPNVIPVYEAGERDGTLYLIMRWVEGTDLRTQIATSGRLSPGRAIKLLRPVASALAAAHRRGLVHRDVKPANVLIARGDEHDEDDDHVYLTDFGIARRTDSDSLTRTGMFVGTVDYTAPERFQGGKGDAASDIYSFGCVLFEALTGHVPYERPTSVSKIYAHVSDPIPSARDEVPEVPAELDAIITKAMAKLPEDRFASAGELTAALGEALWSLDTAERAAAAPRKPAEATNWLESTGGADDAATATEPAAAPDEPGPTRLASPGSTAEPAATRMAAASANAPAPPVTEPTAPSGPPPSDVQGARTAAPRRRRSPWLWAAPIIVLSLIGVLVATFSDVHSQSGTPAAASRTTAAPTTTAVKVTGGGMSVGTSFTVPGAPGSVSVGKKNVWVSLPDSGKLVRTSLTTGAHTIFPANGRPNALAAGTRALWVAQPGSQSLAQFNGDSGTQVAAAKLPGRPVAVALDLSDSSAWVADSSGAISHVTIGPSVVGTPAHVDPAATGLGWGEGSVWAARGATNGLIRVNLDTSGSSTPYPAGQRPVAVAVNQGVWVADANGHVSRFDPRPGHLRVNADVAVAPELDAIAATDPAPSVWAISKSKRTLYRVSATGTPAVTGTVLFPSAPVALAVSAKAAWVATQDGKVTQITF